jgi:major vault protein
MIVDKKGNRRVEVGPKNLLLAYDESFEVVELSTGKPKSTDKLLRTVFLRVLNNKVSDICEVETSDHVRVRLEYSLRVNFTDDPMRWFEVENYVKFLCDHVRSVLKGVVKRISVDTFYGQSVDVIRDTILGVASEGGGRPGMKFKENGMHVTDVEVLGVTIGDENIARLLNLAQHEAVESNIAFQRANRALEATQRQEDINRQTAEAKAQTSRRLSELGVEEAENRQRVQLANLIGEIRALVEQKKVAEARAESVGVEHTAGLERERTAAAIRYEIAEGEQALRLAALKAEVEATVARFEAAQGGFSEALLALSNHEVLVKIAEAMSVQQFIGGKNLTDVIAKVFEGTPLSNILGRVLDGKALTGPKTDAT